MPKKKEETSPADLGSLKNWLSKKDAIRFLDIGRAKWREYKLVHGLKTSRIGNKEKAHVKDLEALLESFRK